MFFNLIFLQVVIHNFQVSQRLILQHLKSILNSLQFVISGLTIRLFA